MLIYFSYGSDSAKLKGEYIMLRQTKRWMVWALSTVLLIGMLCSGAVIVSAEDDAPVQATSIDLNRGELSMMPGRTFALKIQALPAAADLTGAVWSTDKADVAYASDGTVIAVGKGTATITATLPNGLKDTCTVTVVDGEAIVSNGGFDDADTGVWSTTGEAAIQAGVGLGDSMGASLPIGSSIQQTLTALKPNTTYEVSASIKSSVKKPVFAVIDIGGTEVASAEVMVGTGWGFRRWTFTTPETIEGEATLTYRNEQTEEDVVFSFDNLYFREKVSYPDLTVDSLTWEGGYGQVDPGTELTFTVTISNIGKVDVTEPVDVDIAAGRNNIFRLSYDKGIKSGETVSITSDAWAAVAGDYMMSAVVNPELKVLESEPEKNNSYQINLRAAEDRVIPTYDNVAQIVDEAGMHNLTFSEDFDDLSDVDTLVSGKPGYKWYTARTWNQTDMTREDYFVKDGVFTLQHKDNKYAIGASTMDCNTWAGYVYNKGYLEVKLRIPQPARTSEDSRPAIWSFSKGKWGEISGENRHWVETDWLEYYGDNSYSITFHDQGYDEEDVMSLHSSTNFMKKGLGDKEWHVMGFLWEQDHIRCYVDGEEVISQTYAEDDIPVPYPAFKMGTPQFDGCFSALNTQENMLFLSGGNFMPMEVDYVRIWQLGGESLLPEEPVEEEPEEEQPADKEPVEEEPEDEQPVDKEPVEEEPEEEQPVDKEPVEEEPEPEEIPDTGAVALPIAALLAAATGVCVFRKRR